MFNGICFGSNIIMINDALFSIATFRHISPFLETCARCMSVNILSEIISVHFREHLTFPSLLRKCFKSFQHVLTACCCYTWRRLYSGVRSYDISLNEKFIIVQLRLYACRIMLGKLICLKHVCRKFVEYTL
jgi:hypothetical protein